VTALARLKRQMERNRTPSLAQRLDASLKALGLTTRRLAEVRKINDALGGVWAGNCGRISPPVPGDAYLCQRPYGHEGAHAHDANTWSD
jgi:hypothetical protein